MTETPKKTCVAPDENEKDRRELRIGDSVFLDTIFDGSVDLVEYARSDLIDTLIAKAVKKAKKEWALQHLADEGQQCEAIEAAVAAERERCAKIAEELAAAIKEQENQSDD